MAYDAVTTAAVAADLHARLLTGRVDKIVQPSDLAVALLLRAAGANHWLLLSAHPQHARVTVTAARMAKAFDEPSPFVMTLRKYLEGARLDAITQVGHERILRLTFRTHNGLVTLIAEVMGKHSNIILVDSKDIILGAVKRIGAALSRHRVVLPNQPYILPPPQMQQAPHADRPRLDPLAVDAPTLSAALAERPGETTLATALVEVCSGVSPQLAREAVYRVEGIATASVSVAWERREQVLELLQGLMAPPTWQPSIARREGVIAGWAAYPLYQHGVEPERYDSIVTVLDLVYSGLESGDALGSTRDNLRSAIEAQHTRLRKKIASLRAGLRTAEEIDRLRRYGEAVLSLAHEIAPGQHELRPSTAFELGDDVVIPLDPTLSPTENAQALFARYRKVRDAAAKVPPLVEEAENEAQFLESALLFVEQAESPGALKEVKDDLLAAGLTVDGERVREPRPGKAKGKGGTYHPGGKEAPKKGGAPALHFTTADGFEVLVGRSARQNEVVTFDLASGGDLWFHARGMPGSHVILKTRGRTPPDTSVERAAELAAYYSRGRSSTTVPVDVVPARSVRRVKGGKPGLVRISGETTVNVHPRAE